MLLASKFGLLGDRDTAMALSVRRTSTAACRRSRPPTGGKASTRLVIVGFVVVLAHANDAKHVVQAQTYCAMFDDGNKSCGIPSLDGCRQTISGAGGYCTPDMTSQMRPDVFDGRRLFPQPPAPPPAGPQDPNWMPPPPGQ